MTGLIDEEYLCEAEAAASLGLSIATLRTWASQRRGPPRVKIGRRVFYRRETLGAWLAGQERDPGNGRRKLLG